jgi:catechol 2,3-dioxygenase-like lactoylglutathione lyase family enzyme
VEQIITKLVQDYDQGKMTRRQLITNLTVAAAAAATTSGSAFAQSSGYVAKAIGINHISYVVKDYKKTAEFYTGLFGMTASDDNGTDLTLNCGDGQITIGSNNRPGLKPPIVDHFGLTIAGWDTDPTVVDKLIAEVKRRGLKTKLGGDSFHIYDPDGYDIQVGGKDQGRFNRKGQIDPSCPVGHTRSVGSAYKTKCVG